MVLVESLLNDLQKFFSNVCFNIKRVGWIEPDDLPVSLSFLRFVGDVLIILQDKVVAAVL